LQGGWDKDRSRERSYRERNEGRDRAGSTGIERAGRAERGVKVRAFVDFLVDRLEILALDAPAEHAPALRARGTRAGAVVARRRSSPRWRA